MGLRLAVAAVALALAASPAGFVASHQQPDGGFAETGQQLGPGLTAWAVLGLPLPGRHADRSRGGLPRQRPGDERERPRAAHPRAQARSAATPAPWSPGSKACAARTGGSARSSTRRSGACSRSGPPAGRRGTSVRYLRRASARAAAGRGTRAARRTRTTPPPRSRRCARPASGRRAPITRGLAYLRRLQRRDGGFALDAGRGSDAQSTAWAIQAFVAADRQPGPSGVPLPRAPAPARRQLPLLEALRRDAGLGHVAGAARARSQAVPASLVSGPWRRGSPRRSSRSATSSSPATREHERGLARAAARGARRGRHADGVAAGRDRPRRGVRPHRVRPRGHRARHRRARRHARRHHPRSDRRRLRSARRTRSPISPRACARGSPPTRSTRPAGRTSPRERARSRTRSAARPASSSATSTSCPDCRRR